MTFDKLREYLVKHPDAQTPAMDRLEQWKAEHDPAEPIPLDALLRAPRG